MNTIVKRAGIIFCCTLLTVEGFTFSNQLSAQRIPTDSPKRQFGTCKYIHSVLSAANDDESNGVQAVSLDGLGGNHELVGENMAKSVAAWLDAEVRYFQVFQMSSYHTKITYS